MSEVQGNTYQTFQSETQGKQVQITDSQARTVGVRSKKSGQPFQQILQPRRISIQRHTNGQPMGHKKSFKIGYAVD